MSSEEQKKHDGTSSAGGPSNGRRLFENTSDESDVSVDNDDKNSAETDGSSSSRGCLKNDRSRKDQASCSARPVRAPQQVQILHF
uniref:Uncharacterized protein n=2 Tax=Caenorhabditis japonica TaxID=281687 RepID=A0A8R1IAD1_CAEJA